VKSKFLKPFAPIPPYNNLSKVMYMKFDERDLSTWSQATSIAGVANVTGPIVPRRVLIASMFKQASGSVVWQDDSVVQNFNLWVADRLSSGQNVVCYSGATGVLNAAVPTPWLYGGGATSVLGARTKLDINFAMWPRKSLALGELYVYVSTTAGAPGTNLLFNQYSTGLPLVMPTTMYTPIAIQNSQIFGLGGDFTDPFASCGEVVSLQPVASVLTESTAQVAAIGTDAAAASSQLAIVASSGGLAHVIAPGNDAQSSGTAAATMSGMP